MLYYTLFVGTEAKEKHYVRSIYFPYSLQGQHFITKKGSIPEKGRGGRESHRPYASLLQEKEEFLCSVSCSIDHHRSLLFFYMIPERLHFLFLFNSSSAISFSVSIGKGRSRPFSLSSPATISASGLT